MRSDAYTTALIDHLPLPLLTHTHTTQHTHIHYSNTVHSYTAMLIETLSYGASFSRYPYKPPREEEIERERGSLSPPRVFGAVELGHVFVSLGHGARARFSRAHTLHKERRTDRETVGGSLLSATELAAS